MIRSSTTVGDMMCARRIAFLLLESQYASCVHISRMTSVFRWKGGIQEEEEFLLSILTRESLKDKVVEIIERIHTYEVPVIECCSVEINSKARSWVLQETDPENAQS
ncbi:MAG: divalent cation tolerance protein CutA [Candidatus Thermoplasmatota archaeon]|nr:divalent cation tolerance protein CutA [Candidatus Thermoplasmatota archaeon]